MFVLGLFGGFGFLPVSLLVRWLKVLGGNRKPHVFFSRCCEFFSSLQNAGVGGTKLVRMLGHVEALC